MGMDATIVLMSKDKEKLSELSDFLDGKRNKPNEGYFHISKDESYSYHEWFVEVLDARRTYASDVYELLTDSDKLFLLEDVCLIHWTDYDDSIVMLNCTDETKNYYIGDWSTEEFDIPEKYFDVPIEQILLNRFYSKRNTEE